MLLTVFGACFASSAIVIVPHEVRIVATYRFLVSMAIRGARLYLPLNACTVDAAGGATPPHATAASDELALGVGVTEGVDDPAGFGVPPDRSAAAANPPPPKATTAATAPARRRCLRRWRRSA